VLIALVARVSPDHEDVMVVDGIQGLLYHGCTHVEPLLWSYETCRCVSYVSEKILHMHYVPTVITSSLFIRFGHMSNGWKE
jgi:hypothetical protein